jgi:hypothetical protein
LIPREGATKIGEWLKTKPTTSGTLYGLHEAHENGLPANGTMWAVIFWQGGTTRKPGGRSSWKDRFIWFSWPSCARPAVMVLASCYLLARRERLVFGPLRLPD